MDQASVDKMIAEAKKAGVDYVRFSVGDVFGLMKGKMCPVRHMRDFLEGGVGILEEVTHNDGQNFIADIPRVSNRGADCMMVAQPDTFRRVPWAEVPGLDIKVGEVQCENHYKLTGVNMKTTPRTIARTLLEELRGYGYDLLYQQELEFSLLNGDTLTPTTEGQLCYVHTSSNDTKRYLFALEKNLEAADIDLEDWHQDYGQGQIEIAIQPTVGIRSADNISLTKHCVKETAIQLGMRADYMTKASGDLWASNANHFNHSLKDLKTGKNAFSDKSRPNQLSEVAEHWLAGVLEHAPALTAFCAPTFNCYRRLNQLWTPNSNNWAIENRQMMVRAKNHTEASTYYESRLSCGASNPYLVLACHLAAGMDGIKRKLTLSPQNDPAAKKLPATLPEALKAVKADDVIMNAMGELFMEWYLFIKEAECKAMGHDLSDESEEAYAQERKQLLQLA